ncbi:hypothetical protein M9H77_00106 [Catharanthus roseus]|nr:hypothetical protein M9H77_00106 [Catharanthus roseus]
MYDVDGREYLDLSSGIAVNALGHGVELAKRLVARSFADRVFFTNSGTEANEAAIKFARNSFIAFSNCFHGRTMGSLALTSKEHYRSPFEPVMPDDRFATVFVEPIQGEGGIYSATREFLQSLRMACDNSGLFLCRTGYLWAHEVYGVYPDIMTLAKPLAGGLPIGVFCSAAIAVLDKISKPRFFAGVSKKGQYFKDLLVEKLGRNPHVKEIRGMGLLIGIELDVSATPLVDACRNSGLLELTAGKGNVVRLVPH